MFAAFQPLPKAVDVTCTHGEHEIVRKAFGLNLFNQLIQSVGDLHRQLRFQLTNLLGKSMAADSLQWGFPSGINRCQQ